MAIYRRGNSWYIDIVFKGTRINRKVATTKTRAKTIEEEIKTKLRLKLLNVTDFTESEDHIVFRHVAEEYLDHLKDTKSDKYAYETTLNYKNHVKDFFTATPLVEIDNDMLLKFQALKKSQGLSNRSVNIYIGIVRKIVNFALAKGYMKKINIKYPSLREPKKLHAFVTPEEFERLSNHLSYDLARKRVRFGRLTGLRPAELTYLSWNDVNFDLGIVKVQSKNIWRIKTDEERTVPLCDEALEILQKLFREKKGKWVFSHSDKPVKCIQRSLKTACKNAGLSKLITPNMIRHTFATHALLAGADVKSVMDIMGHKNMETTHRYLHSIPDNLRRTVQLVQNLTSSKDE